MSILVAGTVAIDNIKTPHAEANQLLGGSASYAAISASYFSRNVGLVGIVGHDFPAEHIALLEGKGISLAGLARSSGESFTWTGEYLDNMNQRVTRHVAINVLENWQPVVPEEARAAKWVVLANMSPDNQLAVLDQCSPEAFVVADTMDLWITIANERLHDVLKRIDLLVINESEAREFAGTDNLILAGERLRGKGPRYVVIKLGEHGSFLFGEDQHHFFSCAAFPLKEVNDPTGAGDTFLGGLAGHLASIEAQEPGFEELKAAVVRGTIMASFTCEAFSTRRVEALQDEEIGERLSLFRLYTSF